jgi:hypothetical protein
LLLNSYPYTLLRCVLLLSWYSLTGNDADLCLSLLQRRINKKISQLEHIAGSNKLLYGTLTLGSEGTKEAIHGFEDVYVHSHTLK